MNTKDRFTHDEWQIIMNGPARAGLLVMAAAPSGVTGLLAETRALAQVLQDLIHEHPDSGLLADMAYDFEHKPDTARGSATPHNLKEVRNVALTEVRQAYSLVRNKTSDEDAAQYRSLLLNVAHRVAQAASEGGFLGIGGVQVTDGERRAIEQLQDVLQQPATDPPDSLA